MKLKCHDEQLAFPLPPFDAYQERRPFCCGIVMRVYGTWDDDGEDLAGWWRCSICRKVLVMFGEPTEDDLI